MRTQAPLSSDGARRHTVAIHVAVITLATVVVAAPSLEGTLRNDDLYHVQRTDAFLDERGLLSIFAGSQQHDERLTYGWDRYAERDDLYRPLVDLSYAVDRVLYGMWYPGYRMTNIVLSLSSALALYAAAASLIGPTAGLLAALLFVSNHTHDHPLVGQIAGRTDSLAGLFLVLTFALFVTYRTTGQGRYLLASYATAACALFAKETGIGFAGVLLAYDLLLSRRRRGSELLRVHAPYALLVISYCVIRVSVLGTIGNRALVWPSSPGRLVRLAAMPFDVLWPWAAAGDLAVVLSIVAVMGWLFVPILLRDWSTRRIVLFCAVAFYAAAGPAVLMRAPSPRHFFGASAFACLAIASLLGAASAWKRSVLPTLRLALNATAAGAIVLGMVVLGMLTLQTTMRSGRAASAIASDIKDGLSDGLSGAAGRHKVFFVVAPASCGGQGIFFNGLHDWAKLAYAGRVRLYVLSLIQIGDCAAPPQVTIGSELGAFAVAVQSSSDRDELLLSHTDLKRLAPGESLTNAFSRVTLTDLTIVRRRSRSGPSFDRPLARAIAVTPHESVLASEGENHFYYHDGRALWRWEGASWSGVSFPGRRGLEGGGAQQAHSRVLSRGIHEEDR